jgi:predicted phage tail protein
MYASGLAALARRRRTSRKEVPTMFTRKHKNWMQVLGAAAVARRFPLLGIAAAAAGGAFAYYRLRGRSRRNMSMAHDEY